MSFNIIGNMNTYLKSMEMKNIWNLKKKSGNYTSGAADLNQLLDQIAENIREKANAGKEERLQEILQKYYAGQKLSLEERAYLRDHAPAVYKELVNLEQEQAAYERELRRCETKEEVERLRMNRISSSLVTVNAVSNNPNIPDGAKMAILAQEKRRLDAIEESTRKFIASGEYAELPTEAEEAKARKEMLEEQYLQTEQENTDTEEAIKPEEDIASGEADSEKNAEPEIDVESQEERKVRRAKAKAAYAALSPDTPSSEDFSVKLNLKA